MIECQRVSGVRRFFVQITRGLFVATVLLLTVSRCGYAETAPVTDEPVLKVGTRVVKPFVMMENGALTGFSIELWQQLATMAGVRSEFNIHTTLAELLSGVQHGADDAAVAAISVTAEREKIMDFSLPIFKSGLGILAPEAGSPGFMSVISGYFSLDMLQYILGFFGILMIPAHIIWFAERRNCEENDIPISETYFPGIFQAMYWAVATTGGQAEGYPKSWISRVTSLICIYGSIIFVAYFTAYATSGLTVQRLSGDISGPRDLVNKRVAVVKDSTGARFLNGIGVKTMDLPNVDAAIKVLEDGKADAVVYDAPMLLYYIAHDGAGKYRMAGDIFAEQDYAIAFKDNSQLRRTINAALLRLRENGEYAKLYQKWFGSAEGAHSR